MLYILYSFFPLLALIAFVLAIRSLFIKQKKVAIIFGIISFCTLLLFILYFIPFHVQLDSTDVILVSFDSGPHYFIDSQVEPNKFHSMADQLGELNFRHPISSDPRLYDAFRYDTVTITNNGMNIFIIFPSDSSSGYAVLNECAIATITDDFTQYISSLNN